MAGVYSTQFYLGPAGPAQTEVFVVPAGYIAVLRDVSLGVPYGDNMQFIVFANGYEVISGDAVYTDAGSEGSAHWSGRAVFTAGQTLAIAAAYNTGAVVSGYLLTAP